MYFIRSRFWLLRGVSVVRRNLLVSWESQSLWDAAAWQTQHCHLAVTTGADGIRKAGGVRLPASVSELLLPRLHAGERGAWRSRTVQSRCHFMPWVYFKAFRPVCFPLLKKILSTYSLYTVIETCLSTGAYPLIIIFLSQWERHVRQGRPKEYLLGPEMGITKYV